MHGTNEVKKPVAPADDASTFRTVFETPLVNTRRESARNDEAVDDTPNAAAQLDAWARHAYHANGFGDAVLAQPAGDSRPSSYALYHDARAYRSYALGEIVAEALVALVDYVRRAVERARQRREARATYDVLRELDDRSLRDLGLDRSELASLSAELAGETERTRIRAWVTSQSLPV
jgi:uncharacterized protein YjiS (DUF1127 family)